MTCGPPRTCAVGDPIGDYDGDGKADPAVYDKTTGNWKVLRSTAGPYTVNWGLPNVDIPAPGDYDGDGVTDIAVYRPTTAHWFIILSSTQQVSDIAFGYAGEQNIPIVADYDGDAKADLTLLRQKLVDTGNGKIAVEYDWLIFSSESQGIQPYALNLTPSGWTPADYDGNGQADLSYFVVNGSSSFMYTAYLIPGLWCNVHDTVTLPELGDGWPSLALYDWHQ